MRRYVNHDILVRQDCFLVRYETLRDNSWSDVDLLRIDCAKLCDNSVILRDTQHKSDSVTMCDNPTSN